MSATASRLLQQLDDITECPICAHSFTDPRSLPCIHAFCLECLEDYGRGKKVGSTMPCPLCRKDFSIPRNGLSELPKNFFIGKMLQMKQLSNGHQQRSPVLCEVCDAKKKTPNRKTSEAVKYCLECQEKMCHGCSEDHGSHKMLRGHQIIDIDKITGTDSGKALRMRTIGSCPKHKGQELVVFCRNCQTALCMVCYVSSHKQHDCSDLNETIETFRKQMTVDVELLDDGVGKLRQLLASVETQKLEFNKSIAEARETVIRRADELKQRVNTKKKTLLRELDKKRRDVSKQLDDLCHEIGQHASFVEKLKKYTEELSDKGAAGDIAVEAIVLHERVGELLEIGVIQKTRDNISVIDVKVNGSSSVDNIGNYLGKVEVKVYPKVSVPTLARTLTISSGIVGVTSLANHLYVACNNKQQQARPRPGRCVPGQQRIEVYETSTYKLQRNITISSSEQLYDLASCAVNNCLYASDISTGTVYRMAVFRGGGGKTQWTVRELADPTSSSTRPAGISVNNDNNVLVSCYASNSILEYTTHGSPVRVISLQLTGITCPMFAVQRTNGEFVISSDQKVYCLDASGQNKREACVHVMAAVDGVEQSVSMGQPGKLMLLQNDRILVADRGSNQLVLFEPSSIKSRVIVRSSKKPQQDRLNFHVFHLDEQRGRLYVGGEQINDDSYDNEDDDKDDDDDDDPAGPRALHVYENVFSSRDHLV